MESFFTCSECCKMMDGEDEHNPVMMMPCQHTHCVLCLEGRPDKYANQCPTCNKGQQSLISNKWMNEMMEKYEFFKQPINKKFETMRLRISKNFKI